MGSINESPHVVDTGYAPTAGTHGVSAVFFSGGGLAARRLRHRLAFLALLGFFLFGFPLITLVRGDLLGLPMAMPYLFGVWFALIVLAAWAVERGRDKT